MNRNLRSVALGATVVVVMALAGTVQATAIDVLWYTWDPVGSSYRNNVAAFAANVQTYAAGSGLTWNLTFFGPGDTPTFSNYDVMVTESNVWPTVDYSGLLANKAAIEAARGSRTFLSGQDADYHIQNGSFNDDGPRGFVINAVNWAATGTGLGIVGLADGWRDSGSVWFLDNNSFLKAELAGYLQYQQEESVVIPAASAGYPVNAGLTTAGLSNWVVSAHMEFSKSLPGYSSINDAGDFPGWAVTVVTEGSAGGGTGGGDEPGGPVPEPLTMALFGMGVAGLVRYVSKRRAAA